MVLLQLSNRAPLLLLAPVEDDTAVANRWLDHRRDPCGGQQRLHQPLRYIPAQFLGQQLGGFAGVLQPLAREPADGLEMEAVFEAGFPVAVLVALLIALLDLVD